MSNSNEGYLIVPNSQWEDGLCDAYSGEINVNNTHKLISFSKSHQDKLLKVIDVPVLFLNAQSTVDNVLSNSNSAFVLYGDDVHTVLNTLDDTHS